MKKKCRLPAEWEREEFIKLAFPHQQTDWNYMLDEATACYTEIITTILRYQSVLVVCSNNEAVKKHLIGNKDIWIAEKENSTALQKFTNNGISLVLVEIATNDTWARDFSGITIEENNKKKVIDFGFNGWGLKFASNFDNLVTNQLFSKQNRSTPSIANKVFNKNYQYLNRRDFILEGGSIESDGKGTILTTEKCLLSANRNNLSKKNIEQRLKKYFGASRILWLQNGFLMGDDTDSHIDTLARFCDEETIAYVRCEDKNDIHYKELLSMEEELKAFKNNQQQPYRLVPLPMAETVIFNGERLPATYANFLIMNDIVLMPFYNSETDIKAKIQLQKAFPSKEIIGVDCLPLIKQHGSLHCITMQFPV